MNIVFVIGVVGNGGAERVSVTVCEYLREKGHKVHIVCQTTVHGSYEVHPDIDIYELPYHKNFVIKHLIRTKAFFEYCKKVKADIVLTQSWGYSYTFFYRMFTGTPLVLSEVNDPHSVYDHDFSARFQSQLFFRHCDAIVCQTQTEIDYFVKKIRDKCLLIPNPVKPGLPDRWEGEREHIAVDFCRLNPQKNINLLLEAFKLVTEKNDDFILKIYGRGELEEQLKARLIELGLEGRAFILPFSDTIHEDIKKYYMFVSSSDFEGISNSMIEAMGTGLACICTDCPAGGASLMIRDGENGLLTPVGDRQALADAMLRLIADPELTDKLGRNAVQIKYDYSQEKMSSLWLELILKLTGGKSKS